jgi:hypothetical protein
MGPIISSRDDAGKFAAVVRLAMLSAVKMFR